MSQDEKKIKKAAKKPRPKKAARKAAVQGTEPAPSTQGLDRDQLEALREKLQRKFH